MTTASTFSTAVLAAALVTLSAAVGCGHEEAKPAAAPTAAPPPVALGPATPGKPGSSVFLSEKLRQACGITTIESVKEAPKFEFDQQDIMPDDRDVLARVAECLTTGPLKGKSVKLVGRADPRGTQEYNMALGARRSNSVQKFLTNLGVPATQLHETSRGALDAAAHDEAAWRDDRRVDIDVLDAK